MERRRGREGLLLFQFSCGKMDGAVLGLPCPPLSLVASRRKAEGEDSKQMVMKSTLPGFKWRLVIAYDGTNYAGWQFQLSPPTVQCILEKALIRATKLERKDLHLVGASRTDTGVHAWGQVAHFVTPFNYDSLDSIHAALNGLLPFDIRVREIGPVVPEFHARLSAKSKIYHYKIYNDTIMDPLHRLYAYHSAYELNPAVMREAAKHFIGKHDFSSFANASRNDRVPDPVKTIFRFDVVELGALLQLEVEGSGFLYRQVRNMVALLLQIGREAVSSDIVPMILASRDRRELAKHAFSAPPHGLCLVSVNYNEEHLPLPSDCPPTSFGRHRTISKCKLPSY
ncbi:tRNA pseudouridine synthase A 1 isoform X2 [Tripterygium wilfordii]|uniref:tRNA pseudouridine synthase A 1 isoform X2 n=1 Tax=Tripterygium wilfordii TaxID=458696 RepID=UPI0018F84201|nr:tRNA pseudouridine synthase A 1 isoform X2 [Tripterygium wilfordii]